MKTKHRFSTLFLALPLLVGGCPDPDTGEDGGSKPKNDAATGADHTGVDHTGADHTGEDVDIEITGYTCVKDLDLLAEHRACSLDVHCPCGSHCSAGLCVHECLEHSDCDGWCDFFGRCRGAADTMSIHPVTGELRGRLQLKTAHLTLMDVSEVREVELSAVHQALSDVRVVASEGLLVRCASEFVRECLLPSVAADGQRVTVSVKPEATSTRDEWHVSFHHDDQVESVHITKIMPPSAHFPQPGVYVGQIWLSSAEALLQGNDPYVRAPLASGFSMLNLPLQLKVYSDGTVAFTDLFKDTIEDHAGILPEHLVFTLRANGTFDAISEEVDRSPQVYLGGATAVDDEAAVEVVISAHGEMRSVDDGVSGTLGVRMGGFGPLYDPTLAIDERLKVSWGFTATRTGDIQAGDNPPPLGGGQAPVFGEYADRVDHAAPWEAEIENSGAGNLGGADQAEAVQRWLCYSHPSDFTSVSLSINTADLTAMQDLKCDDVDLRPTVFPLFTNLDRTVSLTTQQALGGCMEELAFVASDPPSTMQTGAALLDAMSGCGETNGCNDANEMPTCIDGPLALYSAVLGMESIAPRADRLYWTVASDLGAKLGLRALQQWIQTHTFVVRETAQGVDRLLGGNPNDLETALDTGLNGWDLMLHPKVGARLLHVPPALLAEPDYRDVVTLPEAMNRDNTQPVGLPVVMLDGLTAQLEAASRLIVQARYQSGSSLPSQVARSLRYASILAPIAQMLHTRATEHGQLAWEELWVASQDDFAEELGRVMREWRAYLTGENPLGIDDEDLPLYRGLINPDAAGMRFSAISSYLIENWATDAVATARDAKTAADTAWTALLERQLQMAAQDQGEDRAEAIQRQYGEKILNMCGNPLGLVDAKDVFDPGRWVGQNSQNCFLNQANPSCVYDEQAIADALTADDVMYHMCVVAELNNRLGDKAQLSDAELNAQIREMQDVLGNLQQPESVDWWLGVFDPGLVEIAIDLANQIRDPEGGRGMTDLWTLDRFSYSGIEDERAFFNARQECGSLLPNGGFVTDKLEPIDHPDCYQGALGELVLAARAARKDIEVASSEIQDLTDAYENAVHQCIIIDEGIEFSEHVSAQLGAISGKLETYLGGVQFACDVSSVTMGGILSAASTALAMPDSGLASVFDFVSGKTLESMSNAMGLGEVQQLHADFLAEHQREIANTLCFNDAEMHLVSADTQTKRLERAKIDLAQAVLKLRNGQQELRRLIIEGRNRSKAEAGRARASLFNDIWSDLWAGDRATFEGKVEDYREAMRIAQRIMYLTVRAVEYEWQVTRQDRADVLAATTPDDLAAVLLQLKTDVGTGNIGGQSPENLHVVLRLRDHLLQLEDRSEWPAGQHTMSDVQRFQALLTSERFAEYGDDGSYAGQRIPFSLAPLGIIELGDPGSIPVLTGSDCAERLWSVNASILGDEISSGESTYTRIDLRHSNTFYSQWCHRPAADEPPFLSASTRPSRNLFKDPIWGGGYGSNNNDESEYVRARIQAYFNVATGEMEQESYSQGSSEELACRALYGEYALFFPAEYLDINGSGGLRLHNVEDILLRFDYVSAAKHY
ncbi:MAG: hypothetical protein ABIJ09_13365 [Pseudomonadota bacterium]